MSKRDVLVARFTEFCLGSLILRGVNHSWTNEKERRLAKATIEALDAWSKHLESKV